MYITGHVCYKSGFAYVTFANNMKYDSVVEDNDFVMELGFVF